MKRRSFLLGLGAAALAAPAVARAESLMKIWVPPTGLMTSADAWSIDLTEASLEQAMINILPYSLIPSKEQIFFLQNVRQQVREVMMVRL